MGSCLPPELKLRANRGRVKLDSIFMGKKVKFKIKKTWFAYAILFLLGVLIPYLLYSRSDFFGWSAPRGGEAAVAVVGSAAAAISILLVLLVIRRVGAAGIVAGFLLLSFWLGLTAGFVAPILQSRPYWALSSPQNPAEVLLVPRVAHAGGSISGLTYTNSLEALERNKAHFDLFEIDLMELDDGSIVCLHDLGSSAELHFGQRLDSVSGLTEFLSLREFNESLTPCTLGELAQWFMENPSKILVTDAKTDNMTILRRIASDFPELADQTIPQIFFWEEESIVRELGFSQIIYTTYRQSPSATEILENVAGGDLFAVTLRGDEAGPLTLKLADLGVATYVHTVNDLVWFVKLREWGVSNIYTDHLKETVEGY